MDQLRNITTDMCEKQAANQVSKVSVLDTLKAQRNALQDRLDNLDECIDAMEANPNVTKVLELIAKVR